jgi:hypothetical protein
MPKPITICANVYVNCYMQNDPVEMLGVRP